MKNHIQHLIVHLREDQVDLFLDPGIADDREVSHVVNIEADLVQGVDIGADLVQEVGIEMKEVLHVQDMIDQNLGVDLLNVIIVVIVSLL